MQTYNRVNIGTNRADVATNKADLVTIQADVTVLKRKQGNNLFVFWKLHKESKVPFCEIQTLKKLQHCLYYVAIGVNSRMAFSKLTSMVYTVGCGICLFNICTFYSYFKMLYNS